MRQIIRKPTVTFIAIVLCALCVACGEKSSKMPAASEDFAGKNYEDVISELRQAGFSNIATKAIEDLSSSGTTADGAVELVSVDGVESFQSGDRFLSDIEITVTYHSIKKLNPPLSSDDIQEFNIAEIGEMYKGAGFTNIYTEERFDLDPDNFDGESENEVNIAGTSQFDTFDSFPFDAKVSIILHRPYKKHTLQVHVDCSPNLIFSKYDIDIFLDDVKQETLTHGSKSDYSFRVAEGSHTLTFSKSGSTSVSGSATIDAVSTDVAVSYKLTCYSDRVAVESVYVDRDIPLSESEIKLVTAASEYKFKDYKDVEADLRSLGFTTIKYDILYDIVFGWTPEGEVSDVTINGRNDFTRGTVFPSDAKVIITYHMSEDDDPSKVSPTQSDAPAETESTSVSYSTNDKTTVKNGDTGVYAYRNRGREYYIYYIIDFDNEYVYRFIEGNGEESCERLKIESGTLNDVLIITYHDGDTEWSEGLHFKWKNQPDHLVMQDEDGFEWDYYYTDLEDALALRDTKTIIDY